MTKLFDLPFEDDKEPEASPPESSVPPPPKAKNSGASAQRGGFEREDEPQLTRGSERSSAAFPPESSVPPPPKAKNSGAPERQGGSEREDEPQLTRGSGRSSAAFPPESSVTPQPDFAERDARGPRVREGEEPLRGASFAAPRAAGGAMPPISSSVSAVPSAGAGPQQVRRVLSVSELNSNIRELLEEAFIDVWVDGELSNVKVWNTGHLYFTLKDSSAQIKAVMFRSAVRYLRFKPQDGQHVLVRGRVSAYEPQGDYQLVCEMLEPRGLGQLQAAFEQLK
jgi:hypothetical protein